MAAYSDIPLNPMQDLSNFHDDLQPGPVNGSLLDAVQMVLEEDNTSQWMVDMLSLRKYYRVKFKKRSTVEKFVNHMAFLADNKENQMYTPQQMDVLRQVVNDLTTWIDKKKSECLDDSHWPVSSKYLQELKDIYDAFPAWQNQTYHSVLNWHERMLAIKRELEFETTPERGLSMRDIFHAHVHNLQTQPHVQPHDVSDVQMYADGNLVPPPLASDIDTDYAIVWLAFFFL